MISLPPIRACSLFEENMWKQDVLNFVVQTARGCRGRDHMVVGLISTCAISEYLFPVHCEVYSIQHYVKNVCQ